MAALFAAGEQGFLYDPSDLSTLSQNSDGTGAVTVGDPVGRMLDKSGRGNHATQSIAINRPVLQIDGNGKYYLACNGTNTWMQVASFTPGVGILALAVGVRKTAIGNNWIISSMMSGAINRKWQLNGNANGYGFLHYNDVGLSSAVANTTDYAPPNTATLLSYSDYAQVAVADELKLKINSVIPALTYTNNNISSANYAASQLRLFAAYDGAANFFTGNFYGAVGRFAATNATQLTSMEAYMNSKTGAY